jgi:phage replication-related protein YjqB (UPF0714/DUF867 family)
VAWSELLAHPEVTTTVVLASEVGLLAFHGGVETGTFEVAASAARRAGASLYAVRQPETLRWHVPSAEVDPALDPGLASFLSRIRVALSVHGYSRRTQPWDILLGGRNRDLAATVARALSGALEDVNVVDDLAAIPPSLRGLHPANPVNLPSGAGVQIELPYGLRRSPRHLVQVADALVAVVAGSPLTT